MPVGPPHDRLHLAHIAGVHDRAGDEVILQGNVKRVMRVSETSPANQLVRHRPPSHIKSLVDGKNVRMFNIPPVY